VGEGEFTENAGHDGDAGVLDLALGVVDAQGLERWKTDCFVSAGHLEGIARGIGLIDMAIEVVMRLWRSGKFGRSHVVWIW
jgi:hypothetical protein